MVAPGESLTWLFPQIKPQIGVNVWLKNHMLIETNKCDSRMHFLMITTCMGELLVEALHPPPPFKKWNANYGGANH